ncbi:hypothetical protein F511_03338 [Dorcoceras hygrometricum]|uniref:Sucrose transport protein-like n=1 Tax=Dorcoceras hygrometricum TaxID=472368 RepID=A0A2Z7BFF3_9LAMI|nr:hypothetical protein F511_03338 [Dorcoceras hygrometricum]
MVLLDIFGVHPEPEPEPEPYPYPLELSPVKKLALVASIAAAVQYGWALQLSLLTPYTQFLGIGHGWVSLIWLCGPITGLIVQPIVGQYSDRCTSHIGNALGDSLTSGIKHRAIVVFVLGFWLLDISNNTIQCPCRALLADISGDNDAMVTFGNALFAFFMAVGNIIGFSAGAYKDIYQLLPFTKTEACNLYCADLKTCFLFSIIFMALIITLVVVFVKEERIDPQDLQYIQDSSCSEENPPSLLIQIVLAARSQSRPMWMLYTVTALNWIGCFPFLLYDTDWMGKEVYGGSVVGTSLQMDLYDQGVRAGSLGLVFNVVALGVASLFMDRFLQFLGNVRRLWGVGNFILAICMVLTVLITKMAVRAREVALITQGISLVPPPFEVKISCFALFAAFGIPQAVTYSIPFALASMYSKDSVTGQGLALGLLNLAIVIPQMGVALVIGPLDSVFEHSNLPGFMLGGTAAAIGAIFAVKMLPVE